MGESDGGREEGNGLGGNRLNPIIIPINARVYVTENRLIFDTKDAQMQLLRNPLVLSLLNNKHPEPKRDDEIHLRDET